jgi:hypothetical protein
MKISQVKTKTVNIRLTKSEYEFIKDIKSKYGKTVSEMFRDTILFYSNFYVNRISDNLNKSKN